MLVMSVAIVAFAAIAYVNWVAMREENAERDMVRQKLSDHVQKLKADREYKAQYFYRLLHDERFAERIIREKLGFVGKNEIVFRFDDSDPIGVEMGGEAISNVSMENSETDSLDGLAEDFGRSQLHAPEPRESILSRLMFWRHEAAQPSSDYKPSKGGAGDDSVPQIEIDLLEQSADKNMAAAKEAQKREEESAMVQVKFSFGSDMGKTQEGGEKTDGGRAFDASDFTVSQRHSGSLIPHDSKKVSNIKIGRGTSGSKGYKRPGNIRKIRFNSN